MPFLAVSFTLQGDFATLVAPNKVRFVDALVDYMAEVISVAPSFFLKPAAAAGSIVVTFEAQNTPSTDAAITRLKATLNDGLFAFQYSPGSGAQETVAGTPNSLVSQPVSAGSSGSKNNASSSSSSSNAGAIAGAVIGSIVGAVLIVLAVLYYMRHRSAAATSNSSGGSAASAASPVTQAKTTHTFSNPTYSEGNFVQGRNAEYMDAEA